MNYWKSAIFNVALLIGILNGFVKSEFPTNPKPCPYGDSECLSNIINYFAHEKHTGDANINLVQLDPLKISEISIKQGADSPVNIDVVFSNNDLVGLTTSNVFKVKGFTKDITGKNEIHFKCKKVSLLGDYKINGRILLLPISGNGKANMTMIDTEIVVTFSGSPSEKNGEKYMKVKNMHITFKPGRLYYQFDNLFNGDKELSDNMNLFLNENWMDIFNEVKESLSNAFSKVFEIVVNTVFDKYPYEKYFSEEK